MSECEIVVSPVQTNGGLALSHQIVLSQFELCRNISQNLIFIFDLPDILPSLFCSIPWNILFIAIELGSYICLYSESNEGNHSW